MALSDSCWPEALIGALPVIYPFIVNDPGEAAQAKRRIGAVTLGHVPPPLAHRRLRRRMARLETLLDEFSNADGLDPRRRDRLQADIRAEARALGVEADLGLDRATPPGRGDHPHRPLCLRHQGKPVRRRSAHLRPRRAWGVRNATACWRRWRAARRAGPSGSPYRGRSDVLPTGRNLFTTDPRAVPSRAAYAQGVKLAEELMRRHLQDHGDWPRGLVVDLWGSATMRTAGEEFAMALHLLGAKPVWDERLGAGLGVEILPLALLDRPRIDVTLRVSGLFRDVFPTLAALFGQAVRRWPHATRPPDWNPYAADRAARVYGPRPGIMGWAWGAVDDYQRRRATAAGEAWLAASCLCRSTPQATRRARRHRSARRAADSFRASAGSARNRSAAGRRLRRA